MRKPTWRLCSSILAVTVALTAVTAAQSQSDFSGRWILVRPETATADVARALTVRQPIVRTNVYGAPMEPFFKEISVDRDFGGRVSTDTHQIGMGGGTISVPGPIGRGVSTKFLVRWEDGRLVIDTGRTEDGKFSGRTEVWQLDAAGLLTITVTDRATGAETRTTTATYRRN